MNKVFIFLFFVLYSKNAYSFPFVFYVISGSLYPFLLFFPLLLINFFKIKRFFNFKMLFLFLFLIVFFYFLQNMAIKDRKIKEDLNIGKINEQLFLKKYKDWSVISDKEINETIKNYNTNFNYNKFILNKRDFNDKKKVCDIKYLSLKNGVFKEKLIINKKSNCVIYLYIEKIGVLYLDNISNNKEKLFFSPEKVGYIKSELYKESKDFLTIVKEEDFYNFLLSEKKNFNNTTLFTNKNLSKYISANFANRVYLGDVFKYSLPYKTTLARDYYNYNTFPTIIDALHQCVVIFPCNLTTENQNIKSFLKENLYFYKKNRYKERVVVIYTSVEDIYESNRKINSAFNNDVHFMKEVSYVYVPDEKTFFNNFELYNYSHPLNIILKFLYYLYDIFDVFFIIGFYFFISFILYLFYKKNNKDNVFFYLNFLILSYLFSSLYFLFFVRILLHSSLNLYIFDSEIFGVLGSIFLLYLLYFSFFVKKVYLAIISIIISLFFLALFKTDIFGFENEENMLLFFIFLSFMFNIHIFNKVFDKINFKKRVI